MQKSSIHPSGFQGRHKSVICNLLALFIFTSCLFVFCSSCERDKTPLSLEFSHYTSHEYQWEIDTLDAPGAWQTIMTDIWGTDESNVYVVGHSDDARYKAYHGDGQNWSPVEIRFVGYPSSLTEIHGFSKTDIWAVGVEDHIYAPGMYKDFIVHYNGSEWELMKNIDAPWCFSVWGTSSNNLFVGCDSGIVLHYDGNTWIKQYTSSTAQILAIYGLDENLVYAAGVSRDNKPPEDTLTYYFYKYKNSQWEIMNSAMRTIALEPFEFGYSDIWGMQGVIYSGGYGLYILSGDQWNKIFDDDIFVWALHGNNLNDIFAVGLFGYIFHYNGLDWHQYDQFTNEFIDNSGVWMHGDYVFIIGQPDNYSVILRGKRKKGGGAP